MFDASAIASWLSSNGPLLTALGILSVLLLAVTLFATPRLLSRLPADYFRCASEGPDEAEPSRREPRQYLSLIARNVAGSLLIVLGLVMMVTPGPGLVALLLGLTLCRFPGKRALLLRLAARPGVFASLNWIRLRRGVAPFEHPLGRKGEPAGAGGPDTPDGADVPCAPDERRSTPR